MTKLFLTLLVLASTQSFASGEKVKCQFKSNSAQDGINVSIPFSDRGYGTGADQEFQVDDSRYTVRIGYMKKRVFPSVPKNYISIFDSHTKKSSIARFDTSESVSVELFDSPEAYSVHDAVIVTCQVTND